MRAAPRHLLIHTMEIRRAVNSTDAGGSPITGPPTSAATGVPCRLVILGGSEALRYGAERSRYSHAVVFEASQDVQEQDTLIIDSLQMDVQAVINYDNAGIMKRADCERTKGRTETT